MAPAEMVPENEEKPFAQNDHSFAFETCKRNPFFEFCYEHLRETVDRIMGITRKFFMEGHDFQPKFFFAFLAQKVLKRQFLQICAFLGRN